MLHRIGFVDYDLDNYHANVFLEAIHGPLSERGYVVTGATALEQATSRGWAHSKSIPFHDDLAALAEACDLFMILAPSNPERHWELCAAVLPYGRPTYVDKTFAPDTPTAERIFALADEHGAAVQSCSALRYTAVQKVVQRTAADLRQLSVYAGGSSQAEYLIHPVELAVSCLGSEVQRLLRYGPDHHPAWLLTFAGQRSATIDFIDGRQVPFAATVTSDEGSQFVTVDGARLFVDTAAAILDFFAAGQPLIDRAETMAICRILAAAQQAEPGVWVDVAAPS